MGLIDVVLFFYNFWSAVITSFIRILPPFKPLPKSVKGEIVLVTGAGHGMGRLEAIEFGRRGATVVVVDINEESNEETADAIRETGGRAFSYTCDLSKKKNIEELAAEIRSDVGDITILVNNAGLIYVADFMSITEEKVRRTFDVNVLAHFWLIREFLPAMKRNNHGHIVALASKAGLFGIPYMTDYCASKFAVVGLCEALYRELRALKYDGIHVTYVCPTFVNTGFVKNPSMGFGRVPEPEEVVERLMDAVLYNKRTVTVPEDYRVTLLTRAILPRSAQEVVFNFVNPSCDKVDMRR